jgi:hypothetical protein
MTPELSDRLRTLERWHKAQREHVGRLDDACRVALAMITNLECRKEEAKKAMQQLEAEMDRLLGVQAT